MIIEDPHFDDLQKVSDNAQRGLWLSMSKWLDNITRMQSLALPSND